MPTPRLLSGARLRRTQAALVLLTGMAGSLPAHAAPALPAPTSPAPAVPAVAGPAPAPADPALGSPAPADPAPGRPAPATPAQARPQSALHHLIENMQKARLSFGAGVEESSLSVSPTLVRGLYFVRNPQRNETLGVINARGTLVGGGSRGFAAFFEEGKPARKLNAAETAALRAEILQAVDYERLVRVRYGAGGGRRILEFSAVDCPSCQQLEASLRSLQGRLQSTFYIVPAALEPVGEGGDASWAMAGAIWCASDSGRAWQAWWQHQLPKTDKHCQYDMHTAESESGRLRMILTGVGIEVDYTPALVQEDGTLASLDGPHDSAYLLHLFGADGKPAGHAASASHWLESD